MKIVLSWLLDYLDCSFDDINIETLVHLFNTKVAEIESFQRVQYDPSDLLIGKIVSINASKISLHCKELNFSFDLPFRPDCQIGKMYLIAKNGSSLHWLNLCQFHDEKDEYFPAIIVSTKEYTDGSWRKKIAPVDYVLDIDNKSINHRPDLWGHYGIAREVAAFLHLKLKPLNAVLAQLPVVASGKKSSLQLSIQDEQSCSRLAALACNDVHGKDSLPWMAIRLLRAGGKPINAVVDIANYVMFDIGHPMHAFDAASFDKKEMTVRKAQSGEKLQLLDGQILKLTVHDTVIANANSSVALAGIMGGKDSSYKLQSKNIIIEAAGFDPAIIRHTAQHYKLRTQASIRFEKHLDPMQNITAIKRFVYLAKKEKVITQPQEPIVSVGQTFEPIVCKISQEFIEHRIGSEIKSQFIKTTLQSLGFQVVFDKKARLYHVTVPTYRITKDIGIAEDILEEIIRSYGFENIKQQLPLRLMAPFSTKVVQNIARIKNYVAFAMKMHEVRDYLLYDASFIARLNINLDHAVKVRNPLSQNWTTLVTSLIPHLLKGVELNVARAEHIRLFESNRIWSKQNHSFVESKSLAGIIFDKNKVDFYTCKNELQGLFDIFNVHVVWQKPQESIPAWYDVHKVAQLYVADRCIGWAGMMSTQWLHSIVSGSAFIFELDEEFLQLQQPENKQFKAWSKYQDVTYDMSLLVPLKVTVAELKKDIARAHDLISDVQLVDFFEKEEWAHARSVTFRYTISNPEKTMTKNELQEVTESVEKVVKKHDAQIR
ncbi:MAG TPA: phenylalanine--tRNA ligase subunit beta [Candidatus Saccharimonadales bacterium]|nr:phenylalanine--tRNA ligase subunit beta [Candidatus Saccharimonadales bacterium]